jgi:hypothetical protein
VAKSEVAVCLTDSHFLKVWANALKAHAARLERWLVALVAYYF